MTAQHKFDLEVYVFCQKLIDIRPLDTGNMYYLPFNLIAKVSLFGLIRFHIWCSVIKRPNFYLLLKT